MIELDVIKKHIRESSENLNSQMRSTESSANDNVKKLNEFCGIFESQLSTIDKSLKSCAKSVCENDKKTHELYVSYGAYKNDLFNTDTQINSLKKQVSDLQALVLSEEEKAKFLIRSSIDFFKSELKNAPSELPEIKNVVKNAVDLFKAEFSGARDELANIKHDMFIMEKHIEELFNKFARMK